MRKISKICFLYLLSINYSCSSFVTEGQILEFFRAQYNEIASEELLLNSEVASYSYLETDSEIADPLHRRFAELRLETKHEIYPTLTLEDKERLKRDGGFMSFFVDFLRNWHRTEFYAALASRALDLSRGVPSTEFPLGKPTLPFEVRTRNQTFVAELDLLHQALYEPLDAYMNLMAQNHDATVSFSEFLSSRKHS